HELALTSGSKGRSWPPIVSIDCADEQEGAHRAKAPADRPVGAGHHKTAAGERVQLRGPAGSPDPRSSDEGSDRAVRNPARVERGLDLTGPCRPSPGDGHR